MSILTPRDEAKWYAQVVIIYLRTDSDKLPIEGMYISESIPEVHARHPWGWPGYCIANRDS